MSSAEPDPQTGIEVDLIGHDGNAFAVLGRVRQAMQRAGVAPDVIVAYTAEATAGDYDHLLATTMRYVDVT
jgi:hypothetical protein